MVKNTKESTPTGDNEKELKTTSMNMATDALKQKLAEAQAKYPSWKPGEINAILAGTIVEVKDYPFMHQGKGSIMAVIDTGIKGDDEHIAFWLNTVAQSQLLKLRNERLEKGQNPVEMEADFESRAAAIAELVGTSVIIQYTGESHSTDKAKKNLNAYQKYVIITQE